MVGPGAHDRIQVFGDGILTSTAGEMLRVREWPIENFLLEQGGGFAA